MRPRPSQERQWHFATQLVESRRAVVRVRRRAAVPRHQPDLGVAPVRRALRRVDPPPSSSRRQTVPGIVMDHTPPGESDGAARIPGGIPRVGSGPVELSINGGTTGIAHQFDSSARRQYRRRCGLDNPDVGDDTLPDRARPAATTLGRVPSESPPESGTVPSGLKPAQNDLRERSLVVRAR